MEFITREDLIESVFDAVKSQRFADLIRMLDALYIAKANATTEILNKKVIDLINSVKWEINRLLSLSTVPVCIEDFDMDFSTCDVVTERNYVSVLMTFDDNEPWVNPVVLAIMIHLGNLEVVIWGEEN